MNKVFTPEGMPTLHSHKSDINNVWNKLVGLGTAITKDEEKERNKKAIEIAFPIGTVVFGLHCGKLRRVVEFTKSGRAKLDNGDVIKKVDFWNRGDRFGGIVINGRCNKSKFAFRAPEFVICIANEIA